MPDVRPEGVRSAPRRSGSLEAIRAATAAWLCDVPLQGGEPWPGCAAAAPGSGPCTRCTTTPGGRLVFHVFAALAEFIRELIVEGTRKGLGAARGRGVRLGRPWP